MHFEFTRVTPHVWKMPENAAQLVLKAAYRREFRATPDLEHGLKLHCDGVGFVTEKGEFLAGMGPLFVELLQHLRHTVEIQGEQCRDCSEWKTDSERNWAGDRIVDFIGEHERGLFRYWDSQLHSPHMNVVELVRTIYRAFEEPSIAVVCSRKEDCQRLHWIYRESRGRLRAMMFSHLDQEALRQAELVLITDASQSWTHRTSPALADDVTESHSFRTNWLRQVSGARIYGFQPLSRKLTSQECDLLLEVFGHQTLTILSPESIARPTTLSQCFFNQQKTTVASNASVYQIKKTHIWTHDQRNRWIARIARCLARDEVQSINKLIQAGEHFHPDEKPDRIVVEVDSWPHAYHLGKLIRNAKLVAAEQLDKHGLNSKESKWLKESSRRARPGEVLIATQQGLKKLSHCDVLIRASSGPFLTPLPRRLLSARNTERPLRILEIGDRNISELELWSQRRLQGYRRLFVDQQSAASALDHFLNTRPESFDE